MRLVTVLLGQCYGIPVFYGFSPVCPFLPHMLSPRGCGKGRGNSSRAAHLPFIILSPANYITPVSPLFAARLSSNTMVITIATKNHICKLIITRLVICAFPSNTHPVQLLLQRSPSSLCSPACLPAWLPNTGWPIWKSWLQLDPASTYHLRTITK